jgi:hypothetical protein
MSVELWDQTTWTELRTSPWAEALWQGWGERVSRSWWHRKIEVARKVKLAPQPPICSVQKPASPSLFYWVYITWTCSEFRRTCSSTPSRAERDYERALRRKHLIRCNYTFNYARVMILSGGLLRISEEKKMSIYYCMYLHHWRITPFPETSELFIEGFRW